MVHTRASSHSWNTKPRSSRTNKKNADNGEKLEWGSTGKRTSEGKMVQCHCNYCDKDIADEIHIKCEECSDFKLCLDCFSVGVELTPHKSNHPYRVMEKPFPLFWPDWNVNEEISLLEGIENFGLNNWTKVAKHVGTKKKKSCMEHYRNIYLNSPCFPIPDMSHIAGKNKMELVSMTKWNGDDEHKKGSAESSGDDKHIAVQKASNAANGEEEDVPLDVQMEETSFYNPKRQEFKPEFDDDAEKLVAEMEFNDSDTEEDRELKLRILRIYSKRLDERNRRKDFILERNLLHINPFQFLKDLTPEEIAICRKYDRFMGLHSKQQHDEFLTTVITEHRTRIRLQELKEARAAGCRNSAEADRYLAHKRIREAEADRNLLNKRRKEEEENPLLSPESACKDLSARDAGPSTSSYVNGVDATRSYGADLLSEPEKHLCWELKLPPAEYLDIQQKLYQQILFGNISSRSDAHRLSKMDTHTTDMLYDMLIKKGIAPP